MKSVIFKYLIIFVILLNSLELKADNKDVKKLIQRLSNDDPSLFTSNYLAEGFSLWKRNVGFNYTTIDSYSVNSENKEVWLSFHNSLNKDPYTLAIIFKNSEPIKILDLRKILSVDKNQVQKNAIELINFIERFLWIYDIGRDDYLEDLLYPNFIKLFFENSNDKKEIIKELRKLYNKTLPVQQINWKGRDGSFTIRLQLESTLIPLELNIDIKRYNTAYFFDIADKKERVEQMYDSLNVWEKRKTTHISSNIFYVEAKSSKEATDNFLKDNFMAYELDISKKSSNESIIDAILLPIYDLYPCGLKFRLNVTELKEFTYKIILTCLPIETNNLKVDFSAEKVNNHKMKNDLLSNVLNESILRYTYLGIDNIRPSINKDDRFQGKLIIHSFMTDAFTWKDLSSFCESLSGLTQNKISYYFVRKVTNTKSTCDIVSYALWKDRNLFWHHVAKITDYYHISENGSVKLKNVEIDLYPFVRTDNVLDLFSKPDQEVYRGDKLQIKR